MFFNGGMPRASYGDKYTVTVMKGDDRHTVFDLTSKVSDFLVIAGEASPSCLMILSEEELVAVDLTAPDDAAWPMHSLPYLNPIHASAITCVSHVAGVDSQVYDRLQDAGKNEGAGRTVAAQPWPVSGGSLPNCEGALNKRDVLITGHEDGSVKFWTCGGIALAPIVTVRTKAFFAGDDLDEPQQSPG